MAFVKTTPDRLIRHTWLTYSSTCPSKPSRSRKLIERSRKFCRALSIAAFFAFNVYCMTSDSKFNWIGLPLDLQKVIALEAINDNQITPKKFYKNLLNIRAISTASDFEQTKNFLKNQIESKKNKKINKCC